MSDLSGLRWRLGTVAKISLGGDDFVESDDAAYVTVDDEDGAVCEINIEGEHARAVSSIIAAAPDLLDAAKAVLAGLNDRIDKALAEGGHSVPVFEGIADLHSAIAKAEGRS